MLKSKNKLLHKALAFVLTFSLLATLVSFNFTASAEITGDGTAANPYIISDASTLNDFKTQVESGNAGAYAKLTASFSVSSAWTPIGGSDASTKYTGVFDGGNCTITFSSMTDGEYVGLFASNAGTIKNLSVAGTATNNINTELAFVGGIAGKNSGDIINCKNSIDFTANGKNAVVGGITAVSSGKVSNCENTAAISITTATSDGTVVDKEATAGGIVGLNLNGTVEKSTNKGTVSNTDSNGYAGGIVGCNYGTINNCLNTKSVSNDNSSYAGGIAGYLFKDEGKGDATISNSLNTIDNGNIIGSNGLNDNSHTGTITNCYYKGNDYSIEGTTIVNDLTTGEVTYNLNKGNVSDPVWGQKISDTTTNDPYPVIGITEDSNNIVYANTGNTGYTNNKPQCTNHQYENGVCKVCGDVAAKLVGYTLVDDGVLGMNYYYQIKVSTENVTPKVNFTISGRTIEATGTKVNDKDKYNYKFTVNVNSDEMTRDIKAVLTVGDINVTNSNYSVADYLESLYLDPTSYLSTDELAKAAELQTLAKAMLTYDYYSNMYFKYYDDLGLTVSEPKMGLADLADSNALIEALSSYKPSINEAQTDKTLQHNATTVQLLDETYLRNIVTGDYDGTVYVGYKKTTATDYTYAEATKTSDGYWGATAKIPAAELDCKYQMFFSSAQNDDENSKLSVIKTAGPYSYVYTILNAYKDNTAKTDIVNLVKALYNYGEAAKAYYTTSNA